MRALITEKLSRLPASTPAIPVEGLRDAAVLLPLIERADGMTLLLAQRTQHLHNHPGQISLPGGIIEDSDVSPVAAALRETYEEVGIPPDLIEVIGEMERVDTRTGFRVTPVVGFVAPSVKFALDDFEVESIFEVPLDFLMDGGNYQRQQRVFEDRGEAHFYVLEYDRHYIWGATAQILVNFARHLDVAGIPD